MFSSTVFILIVNPNLISFLVYTDSNAGPGEQRWNKNWGRDLGRALLLCDWSYYRVFRLEAVVSEVNFNTDFIMLTDTDVIGCCLAYNVT